MTPDNTPNDRDVGSANTNEGGPIPGPSRTARHVQWALKPQFEHVEQIVHSDSEDEDQSEHGRTLEEHGSDPAALSRVHQALESYLYTQPKAVLKNMHARRMRRPADGFRSSPEHQRQAESPHQGGDSDEQDLDEHMFDDADEAAGFPMLLSTRLQEQSRGGGDEEAELDEQDREEEKWWEKQARGLVSVHTRSEQGKVAKMKSRKRWVSLLRQPNSSNAQLDEKRPSSHHARDLEAIPDSTRHISPLPRGQGVLSTLLKLYNAGGSVSASSSTPTSRATTPSDSERQSTVIPDEPDAYQKQQGPPTSYFDPHASTATAVSPLPDPPAPTSNVPPSLPSLVDKDTKNLFHVPIPMPSSTASSLHLPSPGLTIHLPTFYTHDTHDGRPKAAKNAGGVVGSLIATSRNLTGAAAPVPSTIAPNVKRKGFRLSRYEIAPETAQIELHEIGHRRARSAPTTPQLPLNTDLGVGDSTPASGTPGTRTPESTSDTATSLTNGRRKHVRHSLATLTEWMPPSLHSRFGSRASAAADDDASDPFDANKEHGKAYRRSRKKRRRKAEIFITKHVAEIMQRQEFLLKLARALMMFAAPTHRLQAQMQATARVLDLDISTLYLPNVMLISFDDAGTSTSNLKFIQQGSSLDLGKLLDAHRLYWKVIHDKISVSSASASLEFLMRKPPLYHGWQVVLLGGLCSSAICPLAFSGSFIDSLVVLPLGSLLVLVQNFSAKNELYSNVFEITIATLLSFISAALASTSRFCYAAVASSSVVLILPGFIVLSGSLELASRQIISGAVRTCFAVIYSLFLGFGLAMGADVYSRMTGLSVVGPDDFTCGSSHKSDGPWWQRTVSIWWAFLCVPLYSLFLSLRNQAPLWRKELAVTIFISCGGWAANHFAGLAFVGRPDIQSALGAFAVGIVANTYARFFSGNAYVVMITGILFQLPSGLANGGLLTFAANDNKGQQFQSYQAGFQVALQLVAVAIGLTVGLFTSVVIVHPLGGSRRRAAGLFSL